MWSIGAGDVAMATALSRFSSTTPRKIGQLSARPVSRMRPPRALLESVASIGLGAHTLVGGAQALLALSWKNPLGVAVGVACIAAGKKIPALSTVAGVLAAVHILSWDRSVPEFPSSTFGPGAAAGSCRIAQSNARNNAGLQPPVVAGTVAEVEKRVVAWIEGEEWGRTGILDRKEVPRGVYLHSRHVSLLWGFADDVFIRISDAGGGRCMVEYQGQLRLGGGDLGVNLARGKRLLAALEAAGQRQ